MCIILYSVVGVGEEGIFSDASSAHTDGTISAITPV